MKVLLRFVPTSEHRRWQETVVFSCYFCGAAYQLEAGDRYEESTRKDAINSPDRGRLSTRCPVCGVYNSANRPILDEPTTSDHMKRDYNWPGITTD